jgi:GNAT superfamily N-acetyltransferase
MANSNQMGQKVSIEAGIRPEHRAQAARGYWQAFARKLRYPLGPTSKAVAFFERVIDPEHALSAVSDTDDFLGAAGFKTSTGSFIGGHFNDLSRVYGSIGATWRGLLIHALERNCEEGTLLMDGIFVEPEARGLGVGTKLLHALMDRAESAGLQRLRLDVIDTNPRARALYEREGFVPGHEKKLGILAPLFGFSTATEMVKTLRPVQL